MKTYTIKFTDANRADVTIKADDVDCEDVAGSAYFNFMAEGKVGEPVKTIDDNPDMISVGWIPADQVLCVIS